MVQHDAQLWNDLLDRSGGALEASKCVFHIGEYGFTPAGKPFYKHFQQNPPSIQIQTNDSSLEHTKLEASKCVFHIGEYGFTPAGKPFYKHFQQNPPSIQIQTNDSSSEHTKQKYLSPFATGKTLGCYKSPSGGSSPKTSRQNQPRCLQADSHLSAPTDTLAESSFLVSHTPFQSILFLRINWQSFKVKPTGISSLS
jgi:uncharacterized pyridoxamine 5'-phosphate oxidase family protein